MKPATTPLSRSASPPRAAARLLVTIGFATALASGQATASAQEVAPAPNVAIATPSSRVPSLAATIAAMPKGLSRAQAPALSAAIAAAEAAQKACTAKGAKVSVLIADTAGEPVVLLSGDGAGVRSQLIARTKAHIVAVYKMPSGDIAEKAKTDAALASAAAADPNIGLLRAGGFPVMRGGEMVGITAVSGGSLGGDMGLDEVCSRVALKWLETH